jgi:hypothetical protein
VGGAHPSPLIALLAGAGAEEFLVEVGEDGLLGGDVAAGDDPAFRGALADDEAEVALEGIVLLEGRGPCPGDSRVGNILQFLVDLDADQVAAVTGGEVDEPAAADRLERAFEAVVEADGFVVPGLKQAGADFGFGLDDAVDPVFAGDVEVVVNDIDGPFPDRLFVVSGDEDGVSRGRPLAEQSGRAACLQTHTPGKGEQTEQQGEGKDGAHGTRIAREDGWDGAHRLRGPSEERGIPESGKCGKVSLVA